MSGIHFQSNDVNPTYMFLSNPSGILKSENSFLSFSLFIPLKVSFLRSPSFDSGKKKKLFSSEPQLAPRHLPDIDWLSLSASTSCCGLGLHSGVDFFGKGDRLEKIRKSLGEKGRIWYNSRWNIIFGNYFLKQLIVFFFFFCVVMSWFLNLYIVKNIWYYCILYDSTTSQFYKFTRKDMKEFAMTFLKKEGGRTYLHRQSWLNYAVVKKMSSRGFFN